MQTLPTALSSAIETLVNEASAAALVAAAQTLSERYRAEAGHAAGRQELLAYLAVRLPATYAALRAVFAVLNDTDPDFAPKSMLDLGAGPGTSGWAAGQAFATLDHLVSVEREPIFIELGRAMAQSGPTLVSGGQWVKRDIERDELPPGFFDLVTVSFTLTELNGSALSRLIDAAWDRTSSSLVLIEPGTTAGFNRLAQIRTALLARGADIAAPCPHLQICPLMGTEEWCHCSVRLPRSNMHRRIKNSSLAFEDEKYSYLIATRRDVSRRQARLLYPIRQSKAAISLFLCRPDGKAVWQDVKIRDKQAYKAARKFVWGQNVPAFVSPTVDACFVPPHGDATE